MKKILIFLLTFLFVIPVSAEIQECPYSEEYIKWLNLSPEKQKEITMPPMCKKETTQPFYNIPNLYSRAYIHRSSTPTKYDLRNVNGVNYTKPTKDQEGTGGCWAFASLNSVETYMKRIYNKEYTLSTRHIEYSTTKNFLNGTNEYGLNRTLGSGGNDEMVLGYYYRGSGPILESAMPFENNEDKINIEEIQNKEVVLDINSFASFEGVNGLCDNTTKEDIKKHLMTYGSVSAGINASGNYFNPENQSLYYPSDISGDSNHAITIVGWDDNYSRHNFENTPPSDGAWLAQNSWGSDWGKDDGYFYVSYNDKFICQSNNGATDIDEELEDNIYTHTPQGGYVSYGSTTHKKIYAANVYKLKTGAEILEEITFKLSKNTNYKIYINKDNDSLDINNFTEIATGTTIHSGYTTIKPNKKIILQEEKYVILMEIQNLTDEYPLGASYPINNNTNEESISISNNTPNQSYLSYSLEHLPQEDLHYNTKKPFIILNASTNTLDDAFNLENVTYNKEIYKESDTFLLEADIIPETNIDNLEVTITKDNSNVTDSFNITTTNNKVSISDKTTLLPGDYTVEFDINEVTKSLNFKVYLNKTIVKGNINNNGLVNYKDNIISIPVKALGYDNDDLLTVEIYDSLNTLVSNESITIENNPINNGTTTINIVFDKTIFGEYNIKIIGEINTLEYQVNIKEYVTQPKELFTYNNTYSILNFKGYITNLLKIEEEYLHYLKFESSNDIVGTITKDGYFEAKQTGTVTITATNIYTNESDSIDIRVVNPKINRFQTTIIGDNEINPKDLFTNSTGTIKINLNTSDQINKLQIEITDILGNPVDYFTVEENTHTENSTYIELSMKNTTPNANYLVKIIGIGNTKELISLHVYEPIKITNIKTDNIRTTINQSFKVQIEVTPTNAYTKNLYTQIEDTNILINGSNGIYAKEYGSTKISIKDKYQKDLLYEINVDVEEMLFDNLTFKDNMVLNLNNKTDYTYLINNLKVLPGEKVGLYHNNVRVRSGYLKTGMVVKKEVAGKTYQYDIVVNGDVNGDGLVNSLDGLKIQRHVLKLETLAKTNQQAADVNKDKKINSLDGLTIQRYVLKLGELK